MKRKVTPKKRKSRGSSEEPEYKEESHTESEDVSESDEYTPPPPQKKMKTEKKTDSEEVSESDGHSSPQKKLKTKKKTQKKSSGVLKTKSVQQTPTPKKPRGRPRKSSQPEGSVTSPSNSVSHATDVPSTSTDQHPTIRKTNNHYQHKRPERWTVAEKKSFYKTLQSVLKPGEYFSKDRDLPEESYAALFKSVPNRAKDVVKSMVSRHCRVIANERSRNWRAVDKWGLLLDSLTHEKTNADLIKQVASAVSVAIDEPIITAESPKNSEISNGHGVANGHDPLENGETPAGEKKGAFPVPNYGNMYKYLSHAIMQKPLPELSPIEALAIEDCMQAIQQQIKNLKDDSLRRNLRQLHMYLTYFDSSEKNDVIKDDILDLLENGTLYNPLGLNKNTIVPVPSNHS